MNNKRGRCNLACTAMLLGLICATTVIVRPAQACSVTRPEISVAQHTEAAELVFTGIVTSGIPDGPPVGDYLVVVSVTRYIKGSGPSEVSIAGFGYGMDCRQPVSASTDEDIFFARKDALGQIHAVYDGSIAAERAAALTVTEADLEANGPWPVKLVLLVPRWQWPVFGVASVVAAVFWYLRRRRLL